MSRPVARISPNGPSLRRAGIVAAGIWLLVAPFLLDYAGRATALWNDILVGLTLIAVSGPTRIARLQPWRDWLTFVAGGWVLGSPWMLGFAGDETARWNHLVVGGGILFLAGSQLVDRIRHRNAVG